jgi:hypothetical protein
LVLIKLQVSKTHSSKVRALTVSSARESPVNFSPEYMFSVKLMVDIIA